MLPRSTSVGFDVEYQHALNAKEIRSTRYLPCEAIILPHSSRKDDRTNLRSEFIFEEDGSFYAPNNCGRGITSDVRIFAGYSWAFAHRTPRGIRNVGTRVALFRIFCSASQLEQRMEMSMGFLAPLSVGRFKPGLGVQHVNFAPAPLSKGEILAKGSDSSSLYKGWMTLSRVLAAPIISLAPTVLPTKVWTDRTWEIFRQYLETCSE